MNLPEARERLEWRDGNRESAGTLAGANQIGAFFREGLAPKRDLAADALPEGSRLPLKAPRCPFSVQQAEKLMQKIHRLTDN
jgi:hypothetical protein